MYALGDHACASLAAGASLAAERLAAFSNWNQQWLEYWCPAIGVPVSAIQSAASMPLDLKELGVIE